MKQVARGYNLKRFRLPTPSPEGSPSRLAGATSFLTTARGDAREGWDRRFLVFAIFSGRDTTPHAPRVCSVMTLCFLAGGTCRAAKQRGEAFFAVRSGSDDLTSCTVLDSATGAGFCFKGPETNIKLKNGGIVRATCAFWSSCSANSLFRRQRTTCYSEVRLQNQSVQKLANSRLEFTGAKTGGLLCMHARVAKPLLRSTTTTSRRTQSTCD